MVSASRMPRGSSGLWLLFCEASKDPTPLHFTKYALIMIISFLLVLKCPHRLSYRPSSSALITEVNAPLLPPPSHVRVQVERARLEFLKWIGKRCLVIRQEKALAPWKGGHGRKLAIVSCNSLSKFPLLTWNCRYRNAHVGSP